MWILLGSSQNTLTTVEDTNINKARGPIDWVG